MTRFFCLRGVGGVLSLAVVLFSLSACSSGGWFGDDDEKPLPGKRISVLELQKKLEPDSAALNEQGYTPPSSWHNEFWPQAGGYPTHAMQNLDLNAGPLKELWRADIGRGATKALPLASEPIVAEGKIFALNTESELHALNATTGQKLWHVKVRPAYESDTVIGGGVAYSRGKLFVSTGYDYLVAISPDGGKALWSARLPAASRAAPTVVDDRVFVTLMDNHLVVLSADDGHTLWDFSGISETAGLVGAASPAVSAEVVVPAFSSGEIFALRVENGTVAWGDNLSTFRRAGGLSSIADIRGLPVIDKDLVLAVSYGDNMAAIDLRTGSRLWQREIGSQETPWVAGDHVFVLSNANQLVALRRDTGVIHWITDLPRFEKPEDRSGPIFWTGPVLAGGRLIMASSTGAVTEVNVGDGKVLRKWDAGRPVSLPLVVAGGMLYMLADDGELLAFK